MSALLPLLREMIAAEGPLTVERFMALALGHPVHGYYVTRDPFGRDFTTAPEISQMFGELLGAWAATVWEAMGRPDPVLLVELGPGRGTLLSDALRTARRLPGFGGALRLHLVETSPILRKRQRETLAGCGVPATWHAMLADVPAGPAILLANEFLDALPVRQYVRSDRGWHERLVGLDDAGALAFGVAPDPEPRLRARARPGRVLEIGEAALRITTEIAVRLGRDAGAALIIDYGSARSALGESLQALREGRSVHPLAEPGEQDLTVHVDFEAVLRAAAAAGATVHGPVGQGDLLRTLGIEVRAARLTAMASPAQAKAVDDALRRLTGPGRHGMGRLFKAVALAAPGLGDLPGFPAHHGSQRPAADPVGRTTAC